MTESTVRHSRRTTSGIVLIGLGVLFLLDTMDVLSLSEIFTDWWPLLLVILGVISMRSGDRSGGILLTVIGLVLLGLSLDIINWSEISDYWPIILIVVGLMIIFEERKKREEPDKDEQEHIAAD